MSTIPMLKPVFAAAVLVAAAAGVLMAAGPQTLAGSEWRPVEITGDAVPDNAGLFVRFEADGKVAGHGGCNRLFGGYAIDNVNLRIGPLASTRKACPAEIMKREAAFVKALEDSRLFLRDSTKLTLKTAQGVTTARFVQTDWD